ncbi:MAG: hypothetical protein FJY80_07790 [Candidatus Aminicenantes bacterium]|nr:hypothetical protein [Candidatus Aminicenantes bacterium]
MKITVTDPSGRELASADGPAEPGLHAWLWDMRPAGRRAGGGAAAGARPRDALEALVPPGDYVVILQVGDKKWTQKARVTKTVGWSVGPFPQVLR